MSDFIPSPWIIAILIAVIYLVTSMARTVSQATVGVVTVFGKYHRTMREGLNFKLPWEKVDYRLSLQNRALQLEFQAITQDQANVKFATMVLYAVGGSDEESIKKAVFSFASMQEFQLALQRTIDGSIRQFVATTKQSDILGMRAEIVDHTKKNLDEVVLAWGLKNRCSSGCAFTHTLILAQPVVLFWRAHRIRWLDAPHPVSPGGAMHAHRTA